MYKGRVDTTLEAHTCVRSERLSIRAQEGPAYVTCSPPSALVAAGGLEGKLNAQRCCHLFRSEVFHTGRTPHAILQSACTRNRMVPNTVQSGQGGGVESSETDPMPQMDRAQRENHESAFKIENGFLGAKL